jgi:hypothetical protein
MAGRDSRKSTFISLSLWERAGVRVKGSSGRTLKRRQSFEPNLWHESRPMQHPHPNPLPKGEGELKLSWDCCTTAALRSHVGSRLRKELQISPISAARFLESRPVI